MLRWSSRDILFEIVDDMTDDPVVTVRVGTPAGSLTFVAEPVVMGTTLLLRGTHVQDGLPNKVGAGNLVLIAQALMEGMGFDGLVVEGAIRTTGANPGRRPRIMRFARRFKPSGRADAAGS
jgi:hypothetical protein